MMHVAHLSLTPQEREKFCAMFSKIDYSGDGGLGVAELMNLFKVLGFNMTKEQLEALIVDVDVDKSGEVDPEEFLYMLVKLGIGSSTEKRTLLPPGASYEEAFAMRIGATELWEMGYDHVP